jgi:hypothetical protein
LFLRYCYGQGLLFTNNTQYTVAKVSQDMFCIVKDNLEDRIRYLLIMVVDKGYEN